MKYKNIFYVSPLVKFPNIKSTERAVIHPIGVKCLQSTNQLSLDDTVSIPLYEVATTNQLKHVISLSPSLQAMITE